MKHSLKSSIALGFVFFSVATVTTAQFDVRVNGRVDFLADYNEPYNNTVTVPGALAGPTTQTFADEAALIALYGAGTVETKTTDEAVTTFNTLGRVDVEASAGTADLNYGGFVRLEVAPDTPTVSDVDGHLYVKGSFGELKFGSDIDAFQDVFETDYVSAGPISAGPFSSNSVSDQPISSRNLVAFGGSLTSAPHEESSIVYSSPIISGVRVEGEIDDESNWGASVSYRSSIGLTDFEVAVATDRSELFGGYLQAAYGDFKAMGFYMADDDQESAGGAGVAYYVGPVNLSLEGSIAETNEINGIKVVGVTGTTTANITSHPSYRETDVVVGAAYDMGPGLELSGSVGITDHDRLGQQTHAQGRIRLKF